MPEIIATHLTVHNGLLAFLPSEVLPDLEPKLTRASLEGRDIPFIADQPIDAVYLVETGMISLVTSLSDGFQADAASSAGTACLGCRCSRDRHEDMYGRVGEVAAARDRDWAWL